MQCIFQLRVLKLFIYLKEWENFFPPYKRTFNPSVYNKHFNSKSQIWVYGCFFLLKKSNLKGKKVIKSEFSGIKSTIFTSKMKWSIK